MTDLLMELNRDPRRLTDVERFVELLLGTLIPAPPLIDIWGARPRTAGQYSPLGDSVVVLGLVAFGC